MVGRFTMSDEIHNANSVGPGRTESRRRDWLLPVLVALCVDYVALVVLIGHKIMARNSFDPELSCLVRNLTAAGAVPIVLMTAATIPWAIRPARSGLAFRLSVLATIATVMIFDAGLLILTQLQLQAIGDMW
jgi:hypothetical protein